MIRVDITQGKLDSRNHEILIGEMIVKALKASGIPVEGFFTVQGVTKGQLIYERGDSGLHIFRWREDNEDREVNWTRGPVHESASIFFSGRHAEDDEL